MKRKKAPKDLLYNGPKDAPAVRVGLVSTAVGYGLFAARDFAQGEFIFHEAPLMTALYNEKYAADSRLVNSQHQAFRTAAARQSHLLHVAYPRLAASNGIAPLPYDEADERLSSQCLGVNLVQGQFAGSTVTREQYEAYCGQLKVNEHPTEDDSRKASLDFFKHYAFQVPRERPIAGRQVGNITDKACIYLLGSLINHCCTPTGYHQSRSGSGAGAGAGGGSGKTGSGSGALAGNGNAKSKDLAGPNCTWRIGKSGLARFVLPRHICVEALRPIKEGEQLTWDYGKRDKGFVCECETCKGSFMGYSCGVL